MFAYFLFCLITKQFVNDLQVGKPITTIDVRTPNESAVLSITLPGCLSIPVNELFLKDNLERIPTDRTVVIICKNGTRATAVGTALRHIGFDNVYILKGGIMALSDYLNPKTANPSKEKTAMR